MIDVFCGEHELRCDICLEPVDEKFRSLQEIDAYKKANKWTTVKESANVALDVCPECLA
ncbi:MAG: hypothetical protein LBR56_07830 [Sporomusaceae bacterium]|jgi:hypothetical protein|nr:hypothetical protein [Sporomusaceae bacterium]